jgi:ABC-type nitrate/sulfonate/bicarbonate transport system substrate-binding protein
MKRFIGFFRKPAACAVLAGCALVLLAGAAPARDKELPVIRLAFSRSIDDLPFFVGIEEKLFEREGVRVEMTRLTGNTTALAGVMRNDIQAAVIGLPQVYSAAGQSIPIKVVAWLGRTHPGTHCGLHVRKDAPIRDLRDLRGKRIAVSGDISSRMMVYQALEKGGVAAADAHVILGLEMSEPMQHEAVLKTGKVDVVVA